MATIGTFTRDQDGFLTGQIRTLTLNTPVTLEPVASQAEGAPAYRVYAGEVELGAAWAKTGRESGRAYHQVRLDDPSFPAPIFANLIEDAESGISTLIWNRHKPAKPQHRAQSSAKSGRRGSGTDSRPRRGQTGKRSSAA